MDMGLEAFRATATMFASGPSALKETGRSFPRRKEESGREKDQRASDIDSVKE
jgi:hypothetical protein